MCLIDGGAFLHQISVIGDTEEILSVLNVPEDIKFEINNRKVTFMSESTKAIENIKEKLTGIILKIIQEKYNRKLILSLLKNRDSSFCDEDESILNADLSAGKAIIEKKLKDFLAGAESISIDGFVKFRLREYKDYLKKRIDIYEEKIASVRETDDLLELLKMYVGMQTSAEELMQIFVLPYGGYMLKNKSDEDITEHCMRTFIKNKTFTEMSFDDILLSCLILTAPKKIIIHGKKYVKDEEFITVIEKVFEGRVCLCKGCHKCVGKTEI